MTTPLRMTQKRLDSLALVRSGYVQRDHRTGAWVVNGNPARRWQGRTFSELEQHGLIDTGTPPSGSTLSNATVAEADPEVDESS